MKRLLTVLALLPGTVLAAPNSWSLASPNRQCAIVVTLGGDGALSYRVSLEGKTVIENSPMGACRDDQGFERGLRFERAGKAGSRREKYELFAGTRPRVDHTLNHRTLAFRNANDASIIIELAASDEGVAFRYCFPESSSEVHVLRAESSGFKVSCATRAWLQPYHEAGDYTPAYEDFYFNVAPGDAPPRSRARPLGKLSPRNRT